MRRMILALVQVLLLAVAWALAARAVDLFHLPLPASVVGLFAVLALLLSGRIPVTALEAGAGLLIGEMLLFFIPPLMAVLRFRDLLAAHGAQLFGVIVVGTLTVMVGTALVVDRTLRWESARRGEPGGGPAAGLGARS